MNREDFQWLLDDLYDRRVTRGPGPRRLGEWPRAVARVAPELSEQAHHHIACWIHSFDTWLVIPPDLKDEIETLVGAITRVSDEIARLSLSFEVLKAARSQIQDLLQEANLLARRPAWPRTLPIHERTGKPGRPRDVGRDIGLAGNAGEYIIEYRPDARQARLFLVAAIQTTLVAENLSVMDACIETRRLLRELDLAELSESTIRRAMSHLVRSDDGFRFLVSLAATASRLGRTEARAVTTWLSEESLTPEDRAKYAPLLIAPTRRP